MAWNAFSSFPFKKDGSGHVRTVHMAWRCPSHVRSVQIAWNVNFSITASQAKPRRLILLLWPRKPSPDTLGRLQTLWGRSGDALGTLWERSGNALGDALGRSGDALGMLRERSGTLWDALEMLWGALGTLWGCSGDTLGRSGAHRGGGGREGVFFISIYTNSRSTAYAAEHVKDAGAAAPDFTTFSTIVSRETAAEAATPAAASVPN